MGIFVKKSIDNILSQSKLSKSGTLGPIDLIMVGLGTIIGSSIFVLTGIVAALYAGPGVVVSYIIAGTVAAIVALLYAEVASTFPTSGSIYSYSQVAFGELGAFAVLGILTLEMLFAAGAVASGFASYFVALLKMANITFPTMYLNGPFEGGIINIPAVLSVFLLGMSTLTGKKGGNNWVGPLLVIIKMITIALFIILAIPHIKIENWTNNFMPFGVGGVVTGASILFLSFNGFNVIPTLADECKNPSKDMIFGILGSLFITMIVYVTIAACATGIAHYTELNSPYALIYVLQSVGSNFGAVLVATGAISGMITGIMFMLIAPAKIFSAASKDGLLPKFFQSNDSGKPVYGIILCTIFACLAVGLVPYQILAQLSSIGALSDFVVFIIITFIFRKLYGNVSRKFKCPAAYLLGSIGLMGLLYLLYKQLFDGMTLLLVGKVFFSWMLAFIVLYFVVGSKKRNT